MACFLPRFILLKSNKRDKYLCYRKEDDSNHAFLQFSGDEKDENVEIQYFKFEVQKSESVEGFVHIRSCYNNKYWVRKSGGDESKTSWIAVEANEAEEDQTKLSCTLFKPVLVDDAEVEEFVEHGKPQKIRLVHVDQVGQRGCVALADSDLLTLQEEDVVVEGEDDVFTAYDAASVFVLPNHVAFTNHEVQYGALTTVSGVTYVDFKTSDIGRSGVAIQLQQYPLAQPPYILSQHLSYGYWHLPSNSNVVRLVSSSASALALTPIRLAGNSIALGVRNQAGRFANCGSSSSIGLAHILGCSASSISENAIFGVHEPVLRREISNVVYNLADSRVYNVSSVDKFRDSRSNSGSVEQTGSVTVEYSESQTKNWSDSVSLTTTITASMSASIPYVGIDLGVELSEEQNQTVVFGTEVTVSKTVTFVQNVTIPPRKRIIVLTTATRAQCDVPFTCRVVDTLSNGTVVSYTKNDGLFTGASEFGFDTQIFEEEL